MHGLPNQQKIIEKLASNRRSFFTHAELLRGRFSGLQVYKKDKTSKCQVKYSNSRYILYSVHTPD
jgi:hypothetical protein